MCNISVAILKEIIRDFLDWNLFRLFINKKINSRSFRYKLLGFKLLKQDIFSLSENRIHFQYKVILPRPMFSLHIYIFLDRHEIS